MSQSSPESALRLTDTFFPIQKSAGKFVVGHFKHDSEMAIKTVERLRKENIGLDVGRVLLRDIWDVSKYYERAFDEGFGLGARLFMAQAKYKSTEMPQLDAFKVDACLQAFDDDRMSPEEYIDMTRDRFDDKDPHYADVIEYYIQDCGDMSLELSEAVVLGSVSAYELMSSQCAIADLERSMGAPVDLL